MKRGGPQGSAANATVLIPPLGNAQLGGRGRDTRERKTGQRAGGGEEGESRRICRSSGIYLAAGSRVVVGGGNGG